MGRSQGCTPGNRRVCIKVKCTYCELAVPEQQNPRPWTPGEQLGIKQFAAQTHSYRAHPHSDRGLIVYLQAVLALVAICGPDVDFPP